MSTDGVRLGGASNDNNQSNPNMNPSAPGGVSSNKGVPYEFTANGTTPSGKPRLFVCQVCTRAFARLEHLRRHERSHTKEKPFSCGVCQRKFSRRDLLLRHAQKLHAGCSDAITRLRRKSIKRSNSTSTNASNNEDVDEDDEDMDIEVEETPKKRMDPVHFNLALFDSTRGSASSPQRKNSESNTPLRLVLDHRKKFIGNRSKRGASFSAQSGANYSIGQSQFSDIYPNPENVEFSTPQMLPSSMNDEISWLNNLSTIPGMTGVDSSGTSGIMGNTSNPAISNAKFIPQNFYDIRQNSISTVLEGTNPPANVSHHGSFSNKLPGSGMESMGYMMPTATITNHELQQGMSKEPSIKEEKDYGYSFYDIPESMLSGRSLDSVTTGMDMPHHPPQQTHFKVLTPIKQEEEDSISHQNGNKNVDFNFLNDIDELTSGYDMNSKFLPNGYSFYGDNPSVSSSGVEAHSPSILSPSLNLNNPGGLLNDTLDQSQLLDLDQHTNHNTGLGNPGRRGNFSRNKLFTNSLRHLLHRALSKYPISGIVNPTIPSNEKLEYYLSKFVHDFLSYLPFIHLSKLNEFEMMNMTLSEDWSNESARVCLPLLIATIGALFANNKRDAEHLYEASRRTIHIYLESRKNSSEKEKEKDGANINPLWLIQSLMLSVIYGLFSDNENNVYIVIRQLSALNSLVKTSIKSKRPLLFSISGEDEECYNKLNGSSGDAKNPESSLFNNNFDQEMKFKNNINLQSQTRIVITIYRLTNFLLMMYNVPLTLSINDLVGIEVPNRDDELLWGFKSYQDFQEWKSRSGGTSFNIEDHLNGPKIGYKDIIVSLTKLSKNDPNDFNNQELFKVLSQMSRFGFNGVVQGLFEIIQYLELKQVDIFVVIDTLAKFYPNEPFVGQSQSRMNQDFEKLEFILSSNYTKISSLIDFKLVKEQSWLRNYEELAKNYNGLLNDNNPDNKSPVSDYDYVRIVDCCLMIIKVILFKSEDDYSKSLSSRTEGSGPSESSGFTTDFSFLNAEFPSTFNGNQFQDLNTLLSDDYQKMGTTGTLGEENTVLQFEKAVNLRIFEEFDIATVSLHSQMLFHVFTILSAFSIYVARKNNPVNVQDNSTSQHLLFELNHRFSMTLKLLDKVESFLKVKYQQGEGIKSEVLDQFFSNLYLYNGERKDNENYTLEKTLYILKIGEVVLNYVFDSNIKVSIFKKLSGSLAQIRKWLIDNDVAR
ncbi:uncharacterized protein CANTADRAFT_6776 [Suhomyces tanzawaensis NRRL Y-17324]|uniref:C2H2-type domain-containing protein n=1 Tax=Suhomyces tanzawaensis NRRL Y-17324 TaxID=984487 RepID=A0A1E4SFU6_9ASCO|nr:uncharacterized protein CANTADRAFT_6776 [Suhomyces tanzawaensis NRRL Y-17324]ODV78384.1 hypothetical protein CANTADRAFT_6776 [Suhomyces tanzawaensis NRRL Y-17324]